MLTTVLMCGQPYVGEHKITANKLTKLAEYVPNAEWDEESKRKGVDDEDSGDDEDDGDKVSEDGVKAARPSAGPSTRRTRGQGVVVTSSAGPSSRPTRGQEALASASEDEEVDELQDDTEDHADGGGVAAEEVRSLERTFKALKDQLSRTEKRLKALAAKGKGKAT